MTAGFVQLLTGIAGRWLPVFKIIGRRSAADCGTDAAGASRQNVAIEPVKIDPLPVVELVGCEMDAPLVGAELTAVEKEEQLVAFALVGSPVDGDEPLGLAVESELFADFATAGGGGGFAAFDVAAGNVPGVFVGGVDEQDPAVAVEEQGAGGNAGSREGAARVRHRPEGTAGYATRWSRRAMLSRATLRGPRWLRSQESTSCRLMAWCLICSGASCSASSMTPRASSRRLRAL